MAETGTKPISRMPIAIIGAGLTGMSAALELRRQGIACRIFEKNSVPGGHAVTIEEGGYRFDRTGHLLHLARAEQRARVLSWLPDCLLIQRKSVVFSHGVYTRYPFQANTFGLPPRIAYECLSGFIAAYHAKPQQPPQNFEQFCQVHFGEGISRHFMLPYNEKLWGVSARDITSDWCQRFVPLPKLEDVLAGAVGLNDRELGYNTHFIYPRLGIGELPRAMHEHVGGIELDKTPLSIDWQKRLLHFSDESVAYGALLNTIPLPSLIQLLDSPPAEVKKCAEQLRCTHLYYLDLALKRPCPKPYHWVYVPEPKYPFYRVGCYSNFSEAMAPAGCSSLYVELASRNPPDLSTLLPEVTQALLEMGLLGSADDLAFVRERKLDYAYVIFDHHYFPALNVIKPFLDQAGIISSGRYGAWNYSSMEDALDFGQKAAKLAATRVNG